jgi:hypothetical protein
VIVPRHLSSTMNKVSLLTIGKKLQDDNLYVLSIYDLEPSGLIVNAYDQTKSKEYILPISEHELARADIDRSTASLKSLLESVELTKQGDDGMLVLQSTNEHIKKIKQRLVGEPLIDMCKDTMPGTAKSLNEILVDGLVELCKVKPVGNDAVKWLGEWLIANNPNKPFVSDEE